MKKGFTLVEILISVLILAVLVTMAFPLYEQAVEKSRISEARTTLKKLHESKMRILDSRGITEGNNYSSSDFGFENLDFSIACPEGTRMDSRTGSHIAKCYTKDFVYSLQPEGNANGVCAARRTGDYRGVNFLYMGDLETDPSKKFQCNNGPKWASCDVYGLTHTELDKPWCSAL